MTHFDLVCELIRVGQSGLDLLYMADELQQSLACGDALVGFTTEQPRFLPTFKRTPGVVSGG